LQKKPKFRATFFSDKNHVSILAKTGWVTFWAIFSQTHLWSSWLSSYFVMLESGEKQGYRGQADANARWMVCVHSLRHGPLSTFSEEAQLCMQANFFFKTKKGAEVAFRRTSGAIKLGR
jgi:hypothetical protein